MNLYEAMCRQAAALLPQMTQRRQDLHKHAESGWLEIRTSSIIAQRLSELGYEVLTGRDVCLETSRMGLPSPEILETQYRRALAQGAVQPWAEQAKDGFTGVIGILRCGEGPVIAMRFDIDALGVHESGAPAHRPAAEGFASVNPGMMHACGHDGHTAIGLAVAEILQTFRSQLRGTVKLIFQPAEEGVRGAKAIADYGHLDDVDLLLASHMGNGSGDYPIGISQSSTLATTKLDAVFHGTAAHAGMTPERGNNAMLSAAAAILNLYAIPRCSLGETRLNVGTLRAGSGRNVVCDEATLELEVRGSTTQANDYMAVYARRILQSAAQMHGCTCTIQVTGSAQSMRNREEMAALCETVCREKLGLTLDLREPGIGGSEDCAYLVNRVESHGGSALYFDTLTPCAGAFHSSTFDFSETALPNAVKVFCAMTFHAMGL